MGWADVTAIASHPSVEVIAGCDVDERSTKKFRERFPDARIYSDYRELLEKEKDLQTVNVSTPDHMHAPIGMAALQRGLHMYGQKPLSHDLYESRRLTEVAREKDLVTQMGIQIHSGKEYRTGVKLIQSGAIGKVKEVHTWSSKKWGGTSETPTEVADVPEGLNWDAWLGVCAERPFLSNGWYHPGSWRKRLDFGTGTFGDMGCHIFDPVFNALALTAPLTVRSEGDAPNDHSWATDAVIQYVFPGTQYTEGERVNVTWYDGDQRPPAAIREMAEQKRKGEEKAPKLPDQGSIFIGTKGIMILPHVAMPRLVGEEVADFQIEPEEGANHYHQFIDAALGKGKTSAGFDYSGPMTESVLLGSVASRFPKETLEWDAAALSFKNVAAANQFVRRAYRAGWETAGL
jgi:predicted dehydrogenase